eukprot:6145874-Pleurochrysis_carterae.AAC.1
MLDSQQPDSNLVDFSADASQGTALSRSQFAVTVLVLRSFCSCHCYHSRASRSRGASCPEGQRAQAHCA